MPSLRSSTAYRIAFTYAAAFAAAFLLLGIAVYLAADAEFRQQRDKVLAEEMEDLAQEGLGEKLIKEIDERGKLRTRADFGYALFDPAGRRIGGRLDVARPPLGYSKLPFQDAREGLEIVRAEAIALSDGSRLVIAIDSEGVEAIDRTILTLFAVAFVAVIAIGVIGALLFGRYLRMRLGTISRTANAIVAGDASQRIAVGTRGDEFDEVALALNAMLDRIDGLMENLRQVSSDVAHDLRTPLLRLRNQLDQVGRVEGAERRAIELGDEMLKLFAAILRIAEVEAGDLQRSFAPVDLSALAAVVAESFAPALADSGHGIDWTIAPDITVLGDRELLAQLITNLLDNVQVHTPPGTAIQLVLGADGPTARLIVTDNGPGVPASDRAQLQRRFFRGEASRTTPGNGLGLSLVAAVAAAHGGSVALADARPGLGVIVSLPSLAS
ncbi:MAG: HAMP domain-containing protein [Sphingomonadales bacterium]|nr:HAMP domain-containing protein [Sphingomonadales bacterium]